MSAATRAAIEEFIKQSGATFWIQHDMALFRTLKKSPGTMNIQFGELTSTFRTRKT